MTSRTRALHAPPLDAQAFAARATARSIHPFTLADLADDAAGGHLAQRWSMSRVNTSTRHWYFQSSSAARWLVVRAAVAQLGGASVWTLGAGVTLALTVSNGADPDVAAGPSIPDGLRGDRTLVPAPTALWAPRMEALGLSRWALDLDALRALLPSAKLWRFELVTTAAATATLECFQVEEAARFAVDTADAYGQLVEDYRPRGLVVGGASGLQRLGVTLEAAYDANLRTYHAETRPQASPWSTTSTTYAPMANDVEPGSVARSYVARGRKMRGAADCRVKFVVRYRTVGMAAPTDKAGVRLHTGGAGSPYVLQLNDTAGAWATSAAGVGYLKTAGSGGLDALHFEAKTASGTLEVCARPVFDFPL